VTLPNQSRRFAIVRHAVSVRSRGGNSTGRWAFTLTRPKVLSAHAANHTQAHRPDGTGRGEAASGHEYGISRRKYRRRWSLMEFHICHRFAACRTSSEQPASEIPLRADIGHFLMGIGRPACRHADNYTCPGRGHTNSSGSATPMLAWHVKLPAAPTRGRCRTSTTRSRRRAGSRARAASPAPTGQRARSWSSVHRPFELKAGEERNIRFSLLVTTVKPLDTTRHFREAIGQHARIQGT